MYNIALISSDHSTRNNFNKILVDQGYDVLAFDSPLPALEKLNVSQLHFDLFISGYQFNNTNGVDFLKEIKRSPVYNKVPFLIFTAVDSEQVQMDALEAGAIDFILRPISNVMFLNKVKSILDNFSAFSLKDRVIHEGSKNDLGPEEIIQYCEVEGISGFAIFCNDDSFAAINFRKGVLESVFCDQLLGAEAIDEIFRWSKFNFAIFRGRYSEKLIDFYRKMRNPDAKKDDKNELKKNKLSLLSKKIYHTSEFLIQKNNPSFEVSYYLSDGQHFQFYLDGSRIAQKK